MRVEQQTVDHADGIGGAVGDAAGPQQRDDLRELAVGLLNGAQQGEPGGRREHARPGAGIRSRPQPSFSSLIVWIAVAAVAASSAGSAVYSDTQQRYMW